MRTVHVGLGTIGRACLRAAAQRAGIEIVGAVDPHPDLVGQDVGRLAGLDTPLQVAVAADWAAIPFADVAIVCTASRLGALLEPAREAFSRQLDVISTCEELAAPSPDDPAAQQLDALACAHGQRLLGTGVNPGFVMDALPLAMTAALTSLRAVHVRRVVDARTRRQQLAEKTGVGLTPAEFETRLMRGELGHVGLPASARLIAAGLGWTIDSMGESVTPVPGPDGRCSGVHQELRALVAGEVRITLDLTIAAGAEPSGDTVWLDGTPALQWSTRPATAGEEATAALVINSLSGLRALPPGLRTMVDLVPLRFRASLQPPV